MHANNKSRHIVIASSLHVSLKYKSEFKNVLARNIKYYRQHLKI